MRRPKVAFIGGYFPFMTGGAEYQSYLLACELRKTADVSFVYIDDGHRPSLVEHDGFHLYRLPKRRLLRRMVHRYFVLDYGRLRRLLKTIGPDVVYQRGGLAYTGIVASYALEHDCKMIWHIAGERDVRPERPRFSRGLVFDYLDRKALAYGIRHADCIVGQAEYQDQLLQENYGRTCDRIIGNFHPAPREPVVKDELVRVVWVGSMRPNKRPEVFIQLAEAFKDVRGVQFTMIGRAENGSYHSGLERLMESATNLDYAGPLPVEEVNRILAASHVLLCTSRREGFPNTFIQAWMRSVPVVSLNIDPDDVIKREKIGFCCDNFESLVRDTRRLIDDPELRGAMGCRAREYALENHALEAAAAKMLPLFQS
jgi:glycosyltransferase involved in cell wall biosynthesis